MIENSDVGYKRDMIWEQPDAETLVFHLVIGEVEVEINHEGSDDYSLMEGEVRVVIQVLAEPPVKWSKGGRLKVAIGRRRPQISSAKGDKVAMESREVEPTDQQPFLGRQNAEGPGKYVKKFVFSFFWNPFGFYDGIKEDFVDGSGVFCEAIEFPQQFGNGGLGKRLQEGILLALEDAGGTRNVSVEEREVVKLRSQWSFPVGRGKEGADELEAINPPLHSLWESFEATGKKSRVDQAVGGLKVLGDESQTEDGNCPFFRSSCSQSEFPGKVALKRNDCV